MTITAHSLVRATLAVVVLVSAFSGSAVAADQTAVEAFLTEQVREYQTSDDRVDLGQLEDDVVGPINVYITDGSATYEFSAVVTEDMNVTEFRAGTRDDALREVSTDWATIRGLADADDPAAAARAAVKSDAITVSGASGHLFEQFKWVMFSVAKRFLL
jgi:hypothetical protein